MIFPRDHYNHDSTIEWWYFWGRLGNGDFFHFATFRGGKGSLQSRASHWSLHNHESKYWEELNDDFGELRSCGYLANTGRFNLQCKKLMMTMVPNREPIIHESKRSYYTIPSLAGKGFLYPASEDNRIVSDVWMDHEWGRFRSLKPWDWVAIRLNCGINIMATQSEDGKMSMIEMDGKVRSSDFILDDRHLYFYDNTMHFTMKPLIEEKIFHPVFGMPYSEVPFEVIGKGEPIGYGIRERAYFKDGG